MLNSYGIGCSSSDKNKTTISTKSSPKIRPWVRFLARSIDILICFVIAGIFLGFFKVPDSRGLDFISWILILFSWVFIESFLLSYFGTTFGKWLLKITVRDKDEKKLTFKTALKRSIYVWFYGMGLGLPIVYLLTMVSGLRSLKKNGITRWDKRFNIITSHQTIGFTRTIFTIFLIVIGIILALLPIDLIKNYF